MCDFVNAGWKRINLDRPCRPLHIGTKPTLFSVVVTDIHTKQPPQLLHMHMHQGLIRGVTMPD